MNAIDKKKFIFIAFIVILTLIVVCGSVALIVCSHKINNYEIREGTFYAQMSLMKKDEIETSYQETGKKCNAKLIVESLSAEEFEQLMPDNVVKDVVAYKNHNGDKYYKIELYIEIDNEYLKIELKDLFYSKNNRFYSYFSNSPYTIISPMNDDGFYYYISCYLDENFAYYGVFK